MFSSYSNRFQFFLGILCLILTSALSAGIASDRIVFVDEALPDYRTLVAALPRDVETRVLAHRGDGLAQIAQQLDGRRGLKSIHILSEGRSGAVQLGALWLDETTLREHADELQRMGAVLAPGGDILLYGCKVADGAAGRSFLSTFGALTRADVAASTNWTGATSRGGNWVLEAHRGRIEACPVLDALSAARYSYVMNTLNAGDIVVLGFNTLTTVQKVTFATLVDIPSGTVIRFTDKGWAQATNTFTVNATGDSVATWTTSSTIAAGTVLTLVIGGVDESPATSLTNITAGNVNLTADLSYVAWAVIHAFPTTSEQIFIYQDAEANPFFIFGLNAARNVSMDATFWQTAIGIPVQDSMIPNGTGSQNALTAGTNAVGVLPGGSHQSNVAYTGLTTSADRATWLARVANNANWTGDNTGTIKTSVGESSGSALALIATAPPSAPALAANASSTTIALTWTIPSGTASFTIRRSTVGYPSAITDGALVQAGIANTTTSLNDVGLTDTTYYYAIFALDADSNVSNPGTAYATVDTTPPSAPTLLASKPSATSNTINLYWDVPSTTATFTLRRSLNGGASSDVFANSTASVTSYSDTNLIDGDYVYSVYAIDSAGNISNAGVSSTVTVDTTSPSAPTLSATKPSGTSSTINLSWDVPSTTATFTLQRSLNGGGASFVFANSAASVTSYSDTNLIDGDYVYSVYAIDSFGNISNAGVSSAVTVDTTSPSAPTLSAAKPSATSNTINLSWDAPSTTATFTLRRSTTSAPTSIADGTLIQSNIASSTTSLSQAGLSDGTYYYAIFALDAFGNVSNAGAAASVTIDTTAPDTPAAFLASTTGSTVALSWVNPVSDFASCTIRRSTSSYPTSITDGTAVGSNLTGTSLNQTSLADGTYYYAIFALDAFGNVSNASTVSVMIDTTATSAPAFFSAVASGSSVALSWTNPVAGDFSSCTIRRSASAYPTTVTGGTSVAANLTGTSRVDTGLADGTYYYAIFALDAFGNISVAATASVTVDTTAPVIGTQPTGGTYAAGASFTLTVAATDSAALAYRWYLGANPVSNDANRAGATAASLTLTNVTTTGFNGNYTVVVTDAAGNATTSTAAAVVVNKAAASVTLSNLAVTYTGSPQSATATTSPGGLTVALTYDGSPTAPTNVGSYAVVATINEANYQGTASGTLVISYVAAAITTDPASRGVLAGSNAPFTVTAIGAPAPTFQWQRLPAGSGTWANLGEGGGYSGTATATLTVGNVTDGMNGDQFRCVVTNVAGSATSTAATLTVGIISPSDAVITFAVE